MFRRTSRRRLIAAGAVLASLGTTLVVAGTIQGASAATVRTWVGNGTNQAAWTTVSNWDAAGAPVPGEDDTLVFPDHGDANEQPRHDFPPGSTYDEIIIQDGLYQLTGNRIVLDSLTTTHTGGSANQVGLSFTDGNTDTGIDVPAGGLDISIGAGGEVSNGSQIQLHGNTVDLAVDGTLINFFGFANTAGGATVNRTGSGVVNFTQSSGAGVTPPVAWNQTSGTTRFNQASYSAIVTQTGGSFEGHQGFIAGYIGNGGTLAPGTVLNGNPIETGQLIFNNFDMNAGGTLDFDINSAQAFDSIFAQHPGGDPNLCPGANATVDLGGTLVIDAAGFTPIGGSTITIINNDCSEPITGVFSNLADGGTINVNGVLMTADYSAGTNNNDLVLTAPAGNTFTWDGSDSANWNLGANWVGNAAPVGNGTETLVFPNGPATLVMNNNVVGDDFADIVFGGANYVINGSRINLTGGITSQLGGGGDTINAPIEFTGGGSIQMQGPGTGTITFGGNVSPDSGTLAVTGGNIFLSNTAPAVNGQLVANLDGAGNANVDLSGGGGVQVLVDQNFVGGTINILAANSNQGIGLTGGGLPGTGVQMHGGAIFGGNESIGNFGADGGQIAPSNPTNNGPGTIGTGNLALAGDAVYQWEAEGAVGDQLNVTGTVSLNNAILTASKTFNPGPITGTSFTIINNDGADLTTGTFRFDPPPVNTPADPTPPFTLADGGIVVVDGIPFTIAYNGGDGNDVVLSIENAAIWDGSSSNVWNLGANWVSGNIPTAGQTLIFPETAANKSNTNNIPGDLAVASIVISGATGGYTLAGNAVTLSGEVFSATNSGLNTMSLPMTFTGGGAINTVMSGQFTSTGPIDIDGGELDLRGQGFVTLSGAYSDGELDVDFTPGGGFAVLTSDQPALDAIDVDEGQFIVDIATIAGEIRAHTGGFLSMAGTATGGIVGDGGFVSVGALADTTEVLNVGTGLEVSSGGMSFDIDGVAANVRDQAIVTGPVNVGGFLSVNSQNTAAVIGTEFTLIDNDGTDPIVGLFNGVPEGGTVLVGGGPVEATVSYQGGTGNDLTVSLSNVFVWTGSGGTALFSNVGNWQSGVAPTGLLANHETLVFSFFGTTFTATNDTPGNFDNIRISGNTAYTIGGTTLTLAGGVQVTSGTATHTVSAPVVLTGGGPVTNDSVGLLNVTGAIDAGSSELLLGGAGGVNIGVATAGDLTKQGPGTATLTAPITNVDDIVLEAGQLVVNENATAPVEITGGRLQGDAVVDGIDATGGTIDPGGIGHATFGSSSPVDIGTGASLTVDVDGTVVGTSLDRLAVNSTVNLVGSLVVRSAVAIPDGTDLVILTSTALTGTFDGLAEGDSFAAGANSFTISYLGNQVTLTAEPPPPLTASLNDDAVTIVEGDAGDTTAGLSVLLSGPAPANTTVHVTATSGTGTVGTDTDTLDLELPVTTGQTSAVIPFDVVGDLDAEVDEAVTVTLSVPSGDAILGAPSVATVTIDDDDDSTVTVIDPVIQITEGGVAPAATPTLTLSLDGPSEVAIDVDIETQDVSAFAPADYAAIDGITTIPAGALSADVPISIVTDFDDEPDETFLVRLLSASGGGLTPQDITVTILDDDIAQIATTSTTSTTTPGGGGGTTSTTRAGGGGGGGGGVGGGGVARTGAESQGTMGLGLALVAFGVVLVLTGRRRQELIEA